MDWVILVVLMLSVSLWLYCCYKDITSDRREKKAIEQALKEAGYV